MPSKNSTAWVLSFSLACTINFLIVFLSVLKPLILASMGPSGINFKPAVDVVFFNNTPLPSQSLQVVVRT